MSTSILGQEWLHFRRRLRLLWSFMTGKRRQPSDTAVPRLASR